MNPTLKGDQIFNGAADDGTADFHGTAVECLLVYVAGGHGFEFAGFLVKQHQETPFRPGQLDNRIHDQVQQLFQVKRCPQLGTHLIQRR